MQLEFDNNSRVQESNPRNELCNKYGLMKSRSTTALSTAHNSQPLFIPRSCRTGNIDLDSSQNCSLERIAASRWDLIPHFIPHFQPQVSSELNIHIKSSLSPSQCPAQKTPMNISHQIIIISAVSIPLSQYQYHFSSPDYHFPICPKTPLPTLHYPNTLNAFPSSTSLCSA